MTRRWLMQRRWTIPLSFLLAVLIAAACGPSIRRTHQSDNAFERCFAMDYRPGAPDTDKETCWTTWLADHVYNQPGDKVRYARLRLDELAKGVSTPGPPGPPGQFDLRPAPSPDAGVGQAVTGTLKGASTPPSPGEIIATSDDTSLCPSDCDFVFQTCKASCHSDAGLNEGCAGACATSRTACLDLCSKR